MDHQDYRHGGGRDYRVEEGQRRMQQEMRWNLIGEPTRWEFDGEEKVYHA